jgi:hypothetical protein
LLLRVAQATTTHTGTDHRSRRTGPGVSYNPVTAVVPDPDLIPEVNASVLAKDHRTTTVTSRQIPPISAQASNAQLQEDIDLVSRPRDLDEEL